MNLYCMCNEYIQLIIIFLVITLKKHWVYGNFCTFKSINLTSSRRY